MPLIYENHIKWVTMLKDRGESILQPKYGKPNGNIRGYIKSQIPHKDVGAIFQDKNEAFGLFGDFGALHIRGIAWANLGLCDGKCYYEWLDPESYRPKEEKICPCCGQPIKEGVEVKGNKLGFYVPYYEASEQREVKHV